MSNVIQTKKLLNWRVNASTLSPSFYFSLISCDRIVRNLSYVISMPKRHVHVKWISVVLCAANSWKRTRFDWHMSHAPHRKKQPHRGWRWSAMCQVRKSFESKEEKKETISLVTIQSQQFSKLNDICSTCAVLCSTSIKIASWWNRVCGLWVCVYSVHSKHIHIQ